MPLVSDNPNTVKRSARREDVLPLQNGDNLSSREFLRRYESMPELKKAELINGIVFMGSPVSRSHAKPDGLVHLIFGTYAARTIGVEFVPNITILLDSENTIQPDASLRVLPECGGRSRSEDDLIAGPPELLCEIAASSASIDLHHKFRVYQRNGVQEYIVWVVAEQEIRWFILEDDRYIQQSPDSRGHLSSRVFPGLLLSTKDLLSMDGAAALAALEESLKSPAHASFLQKLQAASAKSKSESKP
jgi:hypothetical protein